MRSAFYYPHKRIRSNSVLKRALLLWDHIHILSPRPSFKPEFENKLEQDAFNLIGRCHLPTDKEKHKAHLLIQEFTSRPTTIDLTYRDDDHGTECFDLDQEKLHEDTWSLLREKQLVGKLVNDDDYPSRWPVGVTITSILAEACAGDSYRRITDIPRAYERMMDLMVGNPPKDDQDTVLAEVEQVAVKVIDLEKLDLLQLLEFRTNETSHGRQLRHRFQDYIDNQVRIQLTIPSNQRAEALRQFESDSRDDFQLLREALKDRSKETILKDILVPALVGSGTANSLGASASVGAAAGAITGLLYASSKFSRERKKILEEHPTAHLYELAGGLRF